MLPRFSQLPQALRAQSINEHLAQGQTPFGEAIPALLAHPEEGWNESGATPSPAPVVIWMHGRTVSKELDPGRYLRWMRAGIATCAIDLPGHGERTIAGWQDADHTLQIAEQASIEIDYIIEALADPRFNHAFDLDRMAIGGMSAGGIVALHRLCREHPFVCAAVEATAGNFGPMKGRPFYVPSRVEHVEPIRHIDRWRPIPFLALHSESDEWIPVSCITSFTDALRERYQSLDADPEMIRVKTWETTGAPYEHYGFGRVSNEAKNLQTSFFSETFGLSEE